jgi:ribosomal protein S18 acetylase RimI-like enzyme
MSHTADGRNAAICDVASPAPGQETLIGSWRSLASLSRGATLIHTQAWTAAVFPKWAPLNNAILMSAPSADTTSAAAGQLTELFAGAGVASWALWIPSTRLDLRAPDQVVHVDGMTRDATTLVMTADIVDDLPSHPGVVVTSVDAANDAGEGPIRADVLPNGGDRTDLQGWVMVQGQWAVAGAWTYLNGTDLGIYAVGTSPDFRRRGLARALMLHVLADGRNRGARTASLQSTPMGQPLYTSLGFVPVGRYEEWVPVPTPRAGSDRVDGGAASAISPW